MTKPNSPAESIIEGLQEALMFTKALANYFEDAKHNPDETDHDRNRAAFIAGYRAALDSGYDAQDIQTIIDRANEPRIKVNVETL